jgi:hypothetical protein
MRFVNKRVLAHRVIYVQSNNRRLWFALWPLGWYFYIGKRRFHWSVRR